MISIEDSLSSFASSNVGENVDDEDYEETEHGQLRHDDEPSWEMCTMSKTVQQRIRTFRQNLMILEQLTLLECGDSCYCFCQYDQNYHTSKLRVPAGIKPEAVDDAATPVPTTPGEVNV